MTSASASSERARRGSPPRRCCTRAASTSTASRSGSEVGGNWRYDNDNRMSLGLPVAAHQHLAAADGVPRLPDARGPAGLPEPLADRAVLRRLRRPLRLPRQDHLPHRGDQGGAGARGGRAAGTTSRLRARPARRAAEPEVRHYENVVVANGHHWDPRWPEPSFPGAETFPGEQIHAHYYKTPEIFAGKRVLVLGIGNSAMRHRGGVLAGRRARPTSRCAAGRTSCRSTCSACPPTT